MKEPLNSERVEPYSRKEWLRYKNLHFCFHVLANNNVGTKTGFL